MTRPTIVVVDDYEQVTALVEVLLRRDGRFEHVGTAADGKEGVRLVRQKRPDVVLLDLSMPRMDGLEALPHITAVEPRPCVIIYSAFDNDETAKACTAAGACALISKRQDALELVPRIHEIWSRARRDGQR